jgi:hypothetical protein
MSSVDRRSVLVMSLVGAAMLWSQGHAGRSATLVPRHIRASN